MSAQQPTDANTPWGKYTYTLEGLATGCYLEGSVQSPQASHALSPTAQRLRFRVDLPARCFVLSVSIKLPNAPDAALVALDDIEIERTLSDGEYQTVYDGRATLPIEPDKHNDHHKSSDAFQLDNTSPKKHASDSPTAVESTATSPRPRKKVLEIRRAADALRIALTDIDDQEKLSPSRRRRSSAASEDGSDSGDLRTLGIAVVGYVRGQTPASNRIKILLNASTKLGIESALADRAELNGLLGLGFLANRRYRQAAELLQRASELVVQVANEDAKSGFVVDEALVWSAELNLLSAHAFFEHLPMSNDGIIQLIHVASMGTKRSSFTKQTPRNLQLGTEFLDLRTELLRMLGDLLKMLVQFLGESKSLAVKMASVRMIEFVSEQLGCAIAPHMAAILNQVLRSYPTCTPFGARERAAASSFSYDSMEDCFERLIDICCRLFPLTEHSVLQALYEHTLVPVFLDGYHETEYLLYDGDVEEAADEVMTTAVSQTLRVLFLVLRILGADARIPTSLVTRILNILAIENSNPRTPLLLRRTALHAWDAVAKALIQSASGNDVATFAEHLNLLREFIPKLLVDFPRPGFEYGEIEEDTDTEIEIFKEEYLAPESNQILQNILKKRGRRMEIVDRHTLRRVLALIFEICSRLSPNDHDDDLYEDVAMKLQTMLSSSIADLMMSSLIDVSYYEAAISGNGPEDENNIYEFGDINTQLKIVGDVLEELFESFWAVVNLLPSSVSSEVVRAAPIRAVLGWCVDRMKYSAPPKGMLRLLHAAVKGLQHELNTPMYKLPETPAAPHEVTFMALYRSQLKWFPQATHEESFELLDILNEAVAEDLTAGDLVSLIRGLGDQGEHLQARTDVSLDQLSLIVATSIPKRPDLVMSSLRALDDPSVGKQRIANGFPKSTRSNTGSFNRRTNSSRVSNSMSRSLYIHIVLASCFDKFDSLGRDARRNGGPSFMGEKLDAFVEHAALTVRCLHACARARSHREYVGAVLGDIFGTCLAMQDHADGRVRLAGFEIFAAALDVLFLAQKAMVLVPSQPKVSGSETNAMGIGAAAPIGNITSESPSMVTELSTTTEKDSSTPSTVSNPQVLSIGDQNRPSSYSPTMNGTKHESSTSDGNNSPNLNGIDDEVERQMQTIYTEGGSCSFYGEDAASSELAFEERGWQMLCAFVTSSLGIGKYVDFVVQRACLEYLKGCMLNALRGRSTGASIIAFEHIGPLWDAVNRLVGSPWRTLNALAMWVICAILNVAIYSSIMAKGRGAARQRSSQLNEFIITQVFPTADSFLKSGTQETRMWGMRLIEVYIRARDFNISVLQAVPVPPGRILRGLDNLKHDWNEEISGTSQSLLELHFMSLNRKPSPQTNSFTAQAQNFMSLKRHQLDEGSDPLESSKVELWFPPLPKPIHASEMEIYCRSLEAFANAEIEGGEEADLIGTHDEKRENENEDDSEIEYPDGDEEDEEEEIDIPLGDNEPSELSEDTESDESTISPGSDDDPNWVPPGTEIDGKAGSEYDSGSDESDQSQEGPEEKPGSAQKENDDVPVPVGEEVTSVNEENEEDDEFTQLESGAQTDESVTQDAENEEEEISATEFEHIESKSSGDEDLEVVDEDEVIDVTDADDVLEDIDVPVTPKPETSKAAQPPKRSSVSELRERFGLPAESSTAPSTGNSSFPSMRPSLNPDLDEKVQVPRRKGSFTNRPTSSVPIDEGDAPKLARRRSIDASGFIGADQISDSYSGKGDRDGEESVAVSPSGRISRRKSFKNLSPKVSSDNSWVRGSDSASSSAGKGTDRDSIEAAPQSSRLVRRKSFKSASGKPEDASKANSSDQELSRRKSRSSIRESSGSDNIGSSSKGHRIARGSHIEEEQEDEVKEKASNDSSSGSAPLITRTRSEGSAGGYKSRRSLPRAPAFVKGGGPQRLGPGGISGSGGGSTSGIAKDSNVPSGAVGKGGTRVDGLPSPGRAKLPRARSYQKKSARGASQEEGGDKKADRSHRFSKREPKGVPFGDDSLDNEDDLLDGLGLDVNESSELGKNLQEGGAVGEALQMRSSSTDDGSLSATRRGSKRNIFDSQHYKSLLEQFETAPAADDSIRRLGSSSRRGFERSSSSTSSKSDSGKEGRGG